MKNLSQMHDCNPKTKTRWLYYIGQVNSVSYSQFLEPYEESLGILQMYN